jgi:hypothetical protein
MPDSILIVDREKEDAVGILIFVGVDVGELCDVQNAWRNSQNFKAAVPLTMR